MLQTLVMRSGGEFETNFKHLKINKMGTRADFYIRQDNQMKWLGSKGYDGYPDGIEEKVLKSTTAEGFEAETETFLKD